MFVFLFQVKKEVSRMEQERKESDALKVELAEQVMGYIFAALLFLSISSPPLHAS